MKTIPRIFSFIALIILCLGASPLTSWSQDKPSAGGKWKWTTSGRGQAMESTLALTQEEGGKLTGKYQGPWGGESEIQDGKIDGDAISFKITRTFRDREFTTNFSGKLGKDTISGNFTMTGGDQDREFDWVAERLPEIDPTGLWKWSTPGRDGEQRDNWVKFKYGKGELSGTYMTGRGFVAINEAKLDGKKVSFQVVRGFRNRTFVTKYEGTLSNEGLAGTIKSQRGDEERSIDWKATRDIPKIEPAGVWTWKIRRRNNEEEIEQKLTLKLEGGKLSGTITRGDEEVAIADAAVKGDEITFKTTTQRNDTTMTSTYVAKIDEDALSGSVTRSGGEWSFRRGWAATRVIPEGDPAGSWVWTTRRGRGGEAAESKLDIASVDGKWSGKYSGPGGDPGIKDLTFKDNHVSFKVERSFNDRTMVSRFQGQVRGDVLKGTIKFGAEDAPQASAWASRWVATRVKQEKEEKEPEPKPEPEKNEIKHADVSGIWNVVVPNPDGDDYELKFNFKSEGDKISGLASGGDWEVELQMGTISGNAITFQSGPAEDSDNKVIYKTRATVIGDAITGITTFSVEGEPRAIRWTGKKE